MDTERPVINGHEFQLAEVSQPGGGQFDELTGVHHFGLAFGLRTIERPAMSDEEPIVGTVHRNRSLEPTTGTDRCESGEYTKSRRVHKKSRVGLLHLGGHRVELNAAAFRAIEWRLLHRRVVDRAVHRLFRTVRSNCVSCTLVTRQLELIISEDRTEREKQKSIRIRINMAIRREFCASLVRHRETIQNQSGVVR